MRPFLSVSVNGKRKASSDVETSPFKKPKVINDGVFSKSIQLLNVFSKAKFSFQVSHIFLLVFVVGFCLFVGNLNKSKTFEEVEDSLDNYFKTQSLLVQKIRLDPSK